jgi:hypothetical protein
LGHDKPHRLTSVALKVILIYDMEPKTSIRFLTIFALILLSLTVLSCSNRNASTYIPPNEGVVGFKDFYVSSNSTELKTSARGTIFVNKDKSDNYTAQIVAWVEVDPMDWGGVEFDIPFGWEITNVISSYPDIGNNTMMTVPFENDPTENDQDSIHWGQWIAIGNKTYSPSNSSDGGSGSVIIELTAHPKGQEPSKALAIMVEVGSDESDETIVTGMCVNGVCSDIKQEGYRILYPDSEVIEVPIIQYDQ